MKKKPLMRAYFAKSHLLIGYYKLGNSSKIANKRIYATFMQTYVGTCIVLEKKKLSQ